MLDLIWPRRTGGGNDGGKNGWKMHNSNRIIPGLGGVVVVMTKEGMVVMTGACVLPMPNVEFMKPGISQ